MNDNAKKWVATLRSGEYKQTKGRLADDFGHCCLGVACELAIEAGVINSYHKEKGSLPSLVKDWLGLRHWSGRYQGENRFLANDNDRGQSFSQIADIIESEPEGLFAK